MTVHGAKCAVRGALALVLVLLTASAASAQTTKPQKPKRGKMLSVGGVWVAPVSFGTATAGLERPDGSTLVVFRADKDQSVEVRCLYRPDALFLRWHARMATKFEAKPMPPPQRIFTHDGLADTLSFYFQGDANAAPNGPPAGRPGDVRMIFGIL